MSESETNDTDGDYLSFNKVIRQMAERKMKHPTLKLTWEK